jgi:hypothetical protein
VKKGGRSRLISVRRAELAASGHMKKVIQSILGTAVRNSTIDVVEGPEGPITDPKEIYTHLTGEWEGQVPAPGRAVAKHAWP